MNHFPPQGLSTAVSAGDSYSQPVAMATSESGQLVESGTSQSIGQGQLPAGSPHTVLQAAKVVYYACFVYCHRHVT